MIHLYQNFSTTQKGPHPQVSEIVLKHSATNFLRPIPAHQLEPFKLIAQFIEKRAQPVILDSCCGTGMSTKKLAHLFPHHTVIGIDKSLSRLKSNITLFKENCLIIRADVIDQWRLIAKEKWPITKHYLLYPNPYPKAIHIKRRFHCHPIFNTMVHMASILELRTNWHIYAEEFAQALATLELKADISNKISSDYFSLFEKKYQNAGCPIYIVLGMNNKFY